MTDKHSKGACFAQVLIRNTRCLALIARYMHDLRLILLNQTIGATSHEESKLVASIICK